MLSRPNIVVLVSTSVDSRMALAPNRTQWEEMDDPRSTASEGNSEVWTEAERMIAVLHNVQARMQGSNSFVKEGEALKPLPAFEGDLESLYQDYLPDEIVHRSDLHTWLVVVDGRGRMRGGYTGADNPGHHMLHLVSYGVPAEYLAFLQEVKIPYLIAGEQRVDLASVMAKMKEKLGVECLVSEAGGKLNGALLRAGLVDEVNVIVRPELIGGFKTPTLFDSPDLKPDEWPTRLRLISAQVQARGFVWLRYETVRQ